MLLYNKVIDKQKIIVLHSGELRTMGKKKKKSIKRRTTQPKEIRLKRARQWLLTYNGTQKHMAKNYRKHFRVDITTAISDLQAIGVEFTEEYLAAVKKSEAERIRQKHLKKQEEQALRYDDFSDDRFAFIAGYTDGGAPYGITWEELGLEPYASYEELMEAYDRRDRQRGQMAGYIDDEFDDVEIDDLW